jgi:hypothetical protein
MSIRLVPGLPTASLISFIPNFEILSTNVQAAIL